MLETMLITDKEGTPIFFRRFSNANYEPQIFSGLISAISMIGFELFKKEVATIMFGTGQEDQQIIVVTRDLFQDGRKMNFVFVCSCGCDTKTFRELATAIFIEAKPLFRARQFDAIPTLANKIIDNRFNGLKQYCEMKS
jgi:hypothetical protein